MRVTHKDFGPGLVIPDVTETARIDEVIVKFDDPLPYLKKSAIAGYPGGHLSGDTMYEDKDIVNICDLSYY